MLKMCQRTIFGEGPDSRGVLTFQRFNSIQFYLYSRRLLINGHILNEFSSKSQRQATEIWSQCHLFPVFGEETSRCFFPFKLPQKKYKLLYFPKGLFFLWQCAHLHMKACINTLILEGARLGATVTSAHELQSYRVFVTWRHRGEHTQRHLCLKKQTKDLKVKPQPKRQSKAKQMNQIKTLFRTSHFPIKATFNGF